METTRSTSPPTVEIQPPEMMEEQGPTGPWPRSSALLVVLIVSFAFGALSFMPLVAGVLFYPAGYLTGTADFIARSAAGDALQIFYEVLVIEIGYIVGKRIAFERDYAWLLIPAYFGAVLGYVIGLPGLETTTVAGGIYVFQTNTLDPTHLQSAFFNSPTLMGMLVSGLVLAFVFQRRSSAAAMPGGDELTSTGRLLIVFVIAAVLAFLAYMMAPIFYVIFKAAVGAASATSGSLYTFETNSSVIANPLLFFVLLYLAGNKVKVFRDTTTVIIMLFIAVVVGAIAGNPIGSYVTSYVATGTGTFPNYLANSNLLTTFLLSVVAVGFAGTFLGYAAIGESVTRLLVKTGVVPPPPVEPPPTPEPQAPASPGA